MSETQSLAEQLQFEIREIVGPLVKRYGQLDSQIERMQKEFDELRAARSQLAKVIRSIDPEAIPPSKYGPRKNGKKGGKVVGQERVQTVAVWLQGHAEEVNAMNDGKGFHSSGLFRTYGSDIGVPDSSLAVVVRTLHEQGLIRLNGHGNGGAKFFKVVVPISGGKT